MKIYNNTDLSVEMVNSLERLGTTRNEWRGRNIRLLQHPNKPDHVISDGITFDNTMRVIAEESKSSWTTALEYAAIGKVYVSK
jgi:hypothetical protein